MAVAEAALPEVAAASAVAAMSKSASEPPLEGPPFRFFYLPEMLVEEVAITTPVPQWYVLGMECPFLNFKSLTSNLSNRSYRKLTCSLPLSLPLFLSSSLTFSSLCFSRLSFLFSLLALFSLFSHFYFYPFSLLSFAILPVWAIQQQSRCPDRRWNLSATLPDNCSSAQVCFATDDN